MKWLSIAWQATVNLVILGVMVCALADQSVAEGIVALAAVMWKLGVAIERRL